MTETLMQGNRQQRRRDRHGDAIAGLLVAVFAASINATQTPFATANDSKQFSAERTDSARAKEAADGLPEDVKRQRLRLRLIARHFNENRETFTFGKCRIRYLTNRADSMEDARADRWKDPPRQDPWEETICFHDDALAWKTRIDQQNAVMKGRYGIMQNGNVAVVYSPEHFRFVNGLHPFQKVIGMGKEYSDPAAIIASAESRKHEGIQLTVQEKVLRDGNEFLLLKYRSTADDYDADFYIDRRRGYLPVITDYFQKPSGELHARKLVLDAHREGTAYFPTHVMQIIQRTPKDAEPYVEVHERKVLAVDLAEPPTADDLAIEITKNAQFRNEGNPNSALTIFANAVGNVATVSVDDIEGIYRQLEEIAAGRKRTEPAGAALYAFGWLFCDTRRGNINNGQFFGRTESGQLLYLAANLEIQQDLALDDEQKARMRNFVEDFGEKLVAEFRPQGLSRAAIAELYDLSAEKRLAKMQRINEKMPAIERDFCTKYLGPLHELLTPAQFRRLQEIRWQLGGSRSMDDATLVQSIGLTAVQQDKISAINAEEDGQLLTYFSTDFSQVPDADVPIFQELMTRVGKMARERDVKALAVLSPSQREKLLRLQGKAFESGGVRK